jgi:hypothetical protein
LAFPPQTIPRLLVPGSTFSETCTSLRPLLPAAAAAWLSYLALVVLLFSPAIRVYDAGSLPHSEDFRTFAYLLAPNGLLNGRPESAAALVAMAIYIGIAAAVFGCWCWAMRAARTIDCGSALPLIALTAALSAPLLFAPGLVSDDLYLYNLYGRAISVYGANPVLSPPSTFAADPHLPWVHWKELPSAYGPIWLMLSAVLSALAADSLTAVAVLYRLAGLGLHLTAVGILWRLLRERHSSPLPLAIFYAWNPLVLLEVVANAHNDVLVACFALLLVGAGMQRRWTRAAAYAACAVMVKPFAVVLVPAVARHLWQLSDGAARQRQLAIACSAGLAVVVALSLPLWSGTGLVSNALNNPAASMYTNTLWELASNAGPAWLGVSTVDIQHPYLDVLRAIAFIGGFAWVLTRRASRRDVPQIAVRSWLVFCLTACWVWPWYFVPVLALAPLAGAAYLPTATALTVGGLLFWVGWPERNVGPLSIMYDWRSLLLFGPLVLVWIWAPARSLVFLALGVHRTHRLRGGTVDGLQTAAG